MRRNKKIRNIIYISICLFPFTGVKTFASEATLIIPEPIHINPMVFLPAIFMLVTTTINLAVNNKTISLIAAILTAISIIASIYVVNNYMGIFIFKKIGFIGVGISSVLLIVNLWRYYKLM